MRKFLAVILVLFAMFPANTAYSKIVRDAELGQPYEFEDNAEITLLDFSFVDEIATTSSQNKKISANRDERIALIKAEITNLSTESVMFSTGEKYPKGKVVILDTVMQYRGKFRYNGMAGQYDSAKSELLRWVVDSPWFVHVNPMYSRDFAFFCRIPKRVVNDTKSPLQMIIKIGDDELIYNIRK